MLEIGYMLGYFNWYFGEELKKMGMNIINDDIIGWVYKDCKFFIGDSFFLVNVLGKLVV